MSNLHKALITAACLLVGAAFLTPARAWPLGPVGDSGMMNMSGGMMNMMGGAIGGMMGRMTGGQTGLGDLARTGGMTGGCGSMMQSGSQVPNSLFPRPSPPPANTRPSPNE